MSGERVSWADLPPRIRRMLSLVYRQRRLILEPPRGRLILEFHGAHVTAYLETRRGLQLDGDQDGPPEAA